MNDKYDGVDTFIRGIGTVRECMGCGALIAGGPTRCIRCAETGDPKRHKSDWLDWSFWRIGYGHTNMPVYGWRKIGPFYFKVRR